MKMRRTASGPARSRTLARPFFGKARSPSAGRHCLPFFQPKLKIGAPNDRFEREADRIADRVVAGGQAPAVQRMCDGCAEEEELLQPKPGPTSRTGPAGASESPANAPLADRIRSLQGWGQPLTAPTRSFFEPRFGRDLTQVRVHTDARAAELATAVSAKAFTVGPDIVFGTAEYAPQEREGRRLLAHELTHVLQQGGNRGVVRRKITFADPSYDRRNPIGRILREEDPAMTTPSINGTQLPNDFAKAGQLVLDALTPKQTAYDPTAKECRFGDFDATLSANVIAPTEPKKSKWQMNIPGSEVKKLPICHAKKSVPVTMTGKPDGETVLEWVESNEKEHVDDLRKACRDHLEPHAAALLAMRAQGDDHKECMKQLMANLGRKDLLAVKDFLDAWLASIKTRDAKGGHDLKNAVKAKKGCAAIDIESRK